jgi:AraC-like DNA-binding protein
MLSAIGEISLRSSRDRTAVVLERTFRGHLVWREQLTFDTRFTPRAPGRGRPCGHLYLVLEGRLTVHGSAAQAAPLAYLLANDEIDQVDAARSPTFQVGGPRVRVIHLRIPQAGLVRPAGLAHGTLTLDDQAWAAAEALVPRAPEPEIGSHVPAASMARFLAAVAEAGVVTPDLTESIVHEESLALRRLWEATRPFYADFAVSTSLRQIALALALSFRQTTRGVAEFARAFDMGGHGFRDATLLMRLRAATLLLSAPGATATEVGKRVGYGTLTAFERALRDAGLPPPSTIQAAVQPQV